MRERQRDEREENVKKTSSRGKPDGEEMRREYRFDDRKSRPTVLAPDEGRDSGGGVGPGRCLRIPIPGIGEFLAAISHNCTPQANRGTVEVRLTALQTNL